MGLGRYLKMKESFLVVMLASILILTACGGGSSNNASSAPSKTEATSEEKPDAIVSSASDTSNAVVSDASSEASTEELSEAEQLRATLREKYDVGTPQTFALGDNTGKWRVGMVANGTPPADYAVEYAKAYMLDGDIHYLINYSLKTTTMFRQTLGIVEAKTTEYVDKEEQDASVIGEGLLLDDAFYDVETGEKITADADPNAGTVDGAELISAVKEAISGSVASDEKITDVTFDGSNLTVFIDLSGAEIQFGTIDDLAEIRISSITDSILDLDDSYYNTWETITLDYGPQGKGVFDKSMVVDQGLGRYFDYPIDVLKK